MRRAATPLKNTARYELPSLSPLHERADYSRKILRINEVIRSIMSISHMERMQLIAINNRCLFNTSKVKRAERTTRKLNLSAQAPLPDLKMIRLDNRRRSLKHEPHRKRGEGELDRTHLEAELYEKYIEEYLEKLRNEGRFDILADRGKLIEEACRQIIARVDADSFPKRKTPRTITDPNQNAPLFAAECEVEARWLKLSPNQRKSHSITEVQYCQELNRIRRSSEYSSKARALNQRLFLRKIKHIKLHSQPE